MESEDSKFEKSIERKTDNIVFEVRGAWFALVGICLIAAVCAWIGADKFSKIDGSIGDLRNDLSRGLNEVKTLIKQGTHFEKHRIRLMNKMVARVNIIGAKFTSHAIVIDGYVLNSTVAHVRTADGKMPQGMATCGADVDIAFFFEDCPTVQYGIDISDIDENSRAEVGDLLVGVGFGEIGNAFTGTVVGLLGRNEVGHKWTGDSIMPKDSLVSQGGNSGGSSGGFQVDECQYQGQIIGSHKNIEHLAVNTITVPGLDVLTCGRDLIRTHAAVLKKSTDCPNLTPVSFPKVFPEGCANRNRIK